MYRYITADFFLHLCSADSVFGCALIRNQINSIQQKKHYLMKLPLTNIINHGNTISDNEPHPASHYSVDKAECVPILLVGEMKQMIVTVAWAMRAPPSMQLRL